MDVDEKLRFIGELRALIRETDKWADEKIASGLPASPAEAEAIDQLLAKLGELKQVIRSMSARGDA